MSRALGLVLLLFVTQRWMDLPTAGQVIGLQDALSYQTLALAAAGEGVHLRPDGKAVPFHHAQRLVAPTLVGWTARATGGSTFVLFTLLVAALIVGLALSVANLVDRLGVDGPTVTLALGPLLLAPYAVRHALAVPPMVPDLVFALGATCWCRGLITGSTVAVLGGAFVAAVGRQTALLALAVAVPWTIVAGRRGRWPVAVAQVVLVLAVYALTSVAARSWDPQDRSLAFLWQGLTAIPEHVGPPGLTPGPLEFTVRLIMPWLLPLAVGLGLLPLVRPGPGVDRAPSDPGPASLLSGARWCTALGIAIAVQPALFGRALTLKAGGRLSALGLGPMTCGLVLLCALRRPRPDARREALVLGGLLLGSLHPQTSIIALGPSAGWAYGVVLGMAACLVFAVVRSWPREGETARPRQPLSVLFSWTM